MTEAWPSTRSTTTPSSAITMFLSGTPVSAASSACARKCRHSPCTGMKLLGRTRFSTYSSSPAGACPDTCTSALPRCTTRAPSRVSSLMIRFTALSFPGTSDEARITVSPSAIRIGWSRAAIRASADIGSPCDPVEISTIRSGGISSASRSSTTSPPGTDGTRR